MFMVFKRPPAAVLAFICVMTGIVIGLAVKFIPDATVAKNSRSSVNTVIVDAGHGGLR